MKVKTFSSLTSLYLAFSILVSVKYKKVNRSKWIFWKVWAFSNCPFINFRPQNHMWCFIQESCHFHHLDEHSPQTRTHKCCSELCKSSPKPGFWASLTLVGWSYVQCPFWNPTKPIKVPSEAWLSKYRDLPDRKRQCEAVREARHRSLVAGLGFCQPLC